MEDKANVRYQHGYESRFIGSQLNAISSECAFKINPTSIRTFKGCNLAGFTVFRKQRTFRLKIICAHPLRDVLHSYVQLTRHECSSLKELGMVEESMRF